MKNNFSSYRLFLIFLGKFFLVYGLLFFLYQFYLNSFNGNIDGVTKWVAEKSTDLLVSLGYEARIIPLASSPSYDFYLNNQPISRIIEGCNSLSVIILFVSFIFSFSNKLNSTLWYAFWGSALLFILNFIRIAGINVLMYYYPDYQVILHDVIFPAIIYGTLFILWMIWVNKFSKYAHQ